MLINRVGISYYNGSKFITEQIESIKKGFEKLPDHFDNQIHIYDDGSTAEESVFLDKIGEKYSFVKVFHMENTGIFLNFMKILANAQTDNVDYFYFSDQDDIWLPNKFVAHIREHKKTEKPLIILNSLVWNKSSNNEFMERGRMSREGHNFSFDVKKLNKKIDFNKLIKYYENNEIPEIIYSLSHDTYIIYLLSVLNDIKWVDNVVAWHRNGESFTTQKNKIWSTKIYANQYDTFYEYKESFDNIFNIKISYKEFNKVQSVFDKYPNAVRLKIFFDNFAMMIHSKFLRNLAAQIELRVKNYKAKRNLKKGH